MRNSPGEWRRKRISLPASRVYDMLIQYPNRSNLSGGHRRARGWGMDRENPSGRKNNGRYGALFVVWVCLMIAACAPEVVPPPLPTYPGKVFTDEGKAFYVWNLRLPGTRQELVAKIGGTQTWVPLSVVHGVRFLGPEQDRYRESEIYTISGEKFRGQVFVGGLLEGTTDMGYWNMPLNKVEEFQMVAP